MKSFLASYSMTVGPNFIIRCNQQPNAISPPEHLSDRKIREYFTLSFALCCCPILLSFVLAVVWTSPTLAPIANSLFLSTSIYRSCVSHTSIVVCHASARDEHPINKIKLARRLFTNTSAIYITDWAIYTSNIVQHEYTKTKSAEIDCVVRDDKEIATSNKWPNRIETHTPLARIYWRWRFFVFFSVGIVYPSTQNKECAMNCSMIFIQHQHSKSNSQIRTKWKWFLLPIFRFHTHHITTHTHLKCAKPKIGNSL